MAENKLIEQFKNFFGRLSSLQKGLFIGIPTVVVVGLILLLSSGMKSGNYKVLFSDLQESDASSIVQSLEEKGIDYQLENGGKKILVPEKVLYKTRVDLAGEGLPESSIVGYELFDRTNLGMSEFVQQVNYRRALEGELSRTVGAMDEVRKVRVHVVIPEQKLFEKDQKEPTASVTLHLKSGRSLSRVSIEGIQTLVAGSVEGLQSENVTIVNHLGKLLSKPPIDENSVAGLTSRQLKQQNIVEENLATKIQSMLNGVLGANNSTAEVTAELNFTQIEQTRTGYDPEEQVIRSEQTINEASQSTDSLSYPAVNMAKEKSNQIQNYEISKNVEHIIHSVGSIDRLSVAVMVNGTTKMTEKDGQKEMQYIPRSDEEMQKLEEIVKNAVGFDPSRNDQVSVINVPFDAVNNYGLEQIQEKPWWQVPENQKLIVLVFLMLLTIFIMYRMLQSDKIKDRLRIALNLPKKVEVNEEELEDEEEPEEELDELDLDEEDLLLMPSELPEQLLLEGEGPDLMEEEEPPEEEIEEEESLPAQKPAVSPLDEREEKEMTEDSMMRQEMKQKLETFSDENTEEAVKLVRGVMAQDLDLSNQ